MNSENKFILLKILQEIEFNFKNSSIDFEGLIQMIINKKKRFLLQVLAEPDL